VSGERLPRPHPKTAVRVEIRNRRVLDDWERLLRNRRDICVRCWDPIASTPTTPVGSRYTRLKGDQAWCEFLGERLPQWQYEIDGGARVKIAVGKDFVVVMSVSTGHPKENE